MVLPAACRYVIDGLRAVLLVEGLNDHQILGLHHVNETVPKEKWAYWDMGFLLLGALMLAGRWVAMRQCRNQTRK